MNKLSDMLFRYIERNTKNYAHMRVKFDDQQNPTDIDPNANHDFIQKWIDKQAEDILGTIRDNIQIFLKCMIKYKVYKIHWGVKRMKRDDSMNQKLTGDLETDADIYIKENKEDSLKGIFLKEKITSNTVIKKLREIIDLFEKQDHEKILAHFETILGYKI